MKTKLLYMAPLVLLMAACQVVAPQKQSKIEAPEVLRRGHCEKPIYRLKNGTAREVMIFANSLVDQVHFCRKEKAALVTIIDTHNKVKAK